nr:thioredoxin domain-containing protein [Sedimenticola hydrogenitrophicus]
MEKRVNAVTSQAHVFEADPATFDTGVLQASLSTPVLLDFSASWCGSCKTLGPLLKNWRPGIAARSAWAGSRWTSTRSWSGCSG